jgi:murein L,D-transpeptidase YcbB/YkuD
MGTLAAAVWLGCTAPAMAPAVPAPADALLLELNIPAFRLDVRAGGRTLRSYRVAVGTRRYPTPVGDYRIDEVVWNPWWHPPDSEWARDRTVTPPGPANPVGRVKLTFRPLYHLHGTPEPESLGTAASHGCVRLSNPDVVELARLVHRSASPDVPDPVLDRLEAEPWRTRTIALAEPVPLRIVYELVEVREGRLEVYPDVYRRSGGATRAQALRVLRRSGIAEEAVDPAALGRLLELGRRAPAALPLAELLRPDRAAPEGEPPRPTAGAAGRSIPRARPSPAG